MPWANTTVTTVSSACSDGLYPDRADYGREEYANCVYVNYWGYLPGHRVELFEEGRPLEVVQVEDEDPLYNISHYLPELARKPVFKKGDARVVSHHMFAARARTATAPSKSGLRMPTAFSCTGRRSNVPKNSTRRRGNLSILF